MIELSDNELAELQVAAQRITSILQDAKERHLYKSWQNLPQQQNTSGLGHRIALWDKVESLRCPYCDSKMGLRRNQTTGQDFAGCQQFFLSGCKGALSLTD